MIIVFLKSGYFKPNTNFAELLDAYLEETNNSIGKLSRFKRDYLNDNYFLQYKEQLEELNIKKLP